MERVGHLGMAQMASFNTGMCNANVRLVGQSLSLGGVV